MLLNVETHKMFMTIIGIKYQVISIKYREGTQKNWRNIALKCG